MPKGPQGQKRLADVIGNAVHVMRIATGEIEDDLKRFARLTAAHSKKVENHIHMVALYTVWYNFVRINSAVKMAPAMAAGLSSKLWEMDDLVAVV